MTMNSSLVLCLLVAVLSGNQASGHRLVANYNQEPDVEHGDSTDLEDLSNSIDGLIDDLEYFDDLEAFLEENGVSTVDLEDVLRDLGGIFSCQGHKCCASISIKIVSLSVCLTLEQNAVVFSASVNGHEFSIRKQLTSDSVHFEINKKISKLTLKSIDITEINLEALTFCIKIKAKLFFVTLPIPKMCKRSMSGLQGHMPAF